MRKIVHAARRAPVAVAADHTGESQVWNPRTGEKLAQFNTVFDGCNRLAVSALGESVIAANWRRGKHAGVACYETSSGREIWHRLDLRQVQSMRFSEQGDWAWCEVDSRSAHCLDAKTGSTLKLWRGVRDVFENPYTAHSLMARRGDLVLGTSERSVSVPRLSPSLREPAFSQDAVCICEAISPTIRPSITQGIVRCLELDSGRERWRYQCPEGHFMQTISYQDDGFFYGVQSGGDRDHDGWVVALIRLTSETGSCTELCRLSPPPPYFGGFGDGILLTPEGDVVSLASGEVTRRLSFISESEDKSQRT